MAKASTVPKKGKNAVIPDAVKAKGAANMPAAEKTATAVIIPRIKASAMSVDVGPAVIAGLDAAYRDEAKGKELIAGANSKRYDLLSRTTQAIVKAAKVDPKAINLALAFSEDKKSANTLNDAIGVALGFREVVTVGTGDAAKEKVTVAAAVSKFFPTSADAKDSPEYKQKQTLRSNFIHMVKKCAQAAAGIIDAGMEAKYDKTAGTLRLTGPAVKKQFGQTSVLLNEKQTVEGPKGEDVKLTEKPSFTAIANKAAIAHGKTPQRRADSRTVLSGDAAFEHLCKSLVSAIEKLPDPLTDVQKTLLESVNSAIDAKL